MANEPTLQYGTSSDWVAYAQGLLGVEATGTYDDEFQAIVDAFQAGNGFSESGIGPMTWQHLTGGTRAAADEEPAPAAEPEPAAPDAEPAPEPAVDEVDPTPPEIDWSRYPTLGALMAPGSTVESFMHSIGTEPYDSEDSWLQLGGSLIGLGVGVAGVVYGGSTLEIVGGGGGAVAAIGGVYDATKDLINEEDDNSGARQLAVHGAMQRISVELDQLRSDLNAQGRDGDALAGAIETCIGLFGQ